MQKKKKVFNLFFVSFCFALTRKIIHWMHSYLKMLIFMKGEKLCPNSPSVLPVFCDYVNARNMLYSCKDKTKWQQQQHNVTFQIDVCTLDMVNN